MEAEDSNLRSTNGRRHGGGRLHQRYTIMKELVRGEMRGSNADNGARGTNAAKSTRWGVGEARGSTAAGENGASVGDQSGPNSEGGDCTTNGTNWDLESCISAIESLGGGAGLSPEQQSAIDNLRVAAQSQSGASNISYRRRHAQRREAKFFGKGYVTKELMKCFHEVEDNKEDAIQLNNVTAVLANFGGQNFYSSSIPPRSKQKEKDDVDSSLGEDSLPTGSLRDSLNLDSIHSFQRDESQHSRRGSTRRSAICSIIPLDCTESLEHLFASDTLATLTSSQVFCPPEWNALTREARAKLASLLSLENLSQWDFNVLDVADLSRETLRRRGSNVYAPESQACPLLLVGWAIICSPLAQQAMEGSLGDDGEEEARITRTSDGGSRSFPYHFVTDLSLKPESVCNFLREIERQYEPGNSYHNNTHAADVTQTLHCFLQFMDQDILESIFDPVETFSLLLAATFHDVGHGGTNNLFQKNARTPLAIRYNDYSILENMHSAVGQSFLMGEEKRGEWDVFKRWSPKQIEQSRRVMICAVLGTDMSKHFEVVGELDSLVEKVRADYMEDVTRTRIDTSSSGGDEKPPILSIVAQAINSEEDVLKKDCGQLVKLILKFLLHAADISNPTKNRALAMYWADNALNEFFAQGEMEKAANLPISPLCDRSTVKRADSQIGFLKFVVRPSYVLLGEILPRVKEEVVPIIDSNIEFWTREKARMSSIRPITCEHEREPS
ncbi:hypothetical protein ACHAXR_009504 [Thalassiosira sp. AJA248-18]